MIRFVLTAVACLFFLNITWSQTDAHYWTHQYGAKGLLLNGAVIASSSDETAIYYNPACMGQNNNLGFIFSYLTPTYSYLGTSNFTGDNSNFTDEDLGFSPGFAAVRFRPFKSKKFVMGLASFERFSSNINYDDRVVLPVDNIENVFYVGDLEFQRKLSQEWLGVGLSYNLVPRIGFGISQFSVWHDENLDLDFQKEVKLEQDPDQVVFGWRSRFGYGINAYAGWVTKLGFIYSADKFKWGLTYTSRLYGIAHKSADYDIDDRRIQLQGTEVRSNRRDIDLADYRVPASYGLGLEISLKKDLILSFSTEYFKEIKEYTLFEDTDDPYNGLSDEVVNESVIVTTSNNGVINFALGIQKKIDERHSWILGLRTDFNQNSTLNFNDASGFLSSSPSIYHISGGTRFISKQNVISVGIDYGYGSKSGGRQLTDLTNLNIFNFFDFGQNNVNTKAHYVMIFLTYDFLFKSINEID